MGGLKPFHPSKFKYKVVDIKDTPTEIICTKIDSVVDWISKAVDNGGNVFVHW